MAKRFTRNISSVENIEKQPFNTNEQNDLLSDDKHVYIRNKDKYENLTNNVKSVNGKDPDEQGNIELDSIEQVEQAADGAKETISQKVTEVSDTSDSAISKVNQAADDTIKTANQAQGDIQTSVSDVQSRQAGAEKDIAGLVESTESARDEAIETMTELDYSNRNLLTGTSSEWEEFSFGGFVAGYMNYSLEQLGLKVGDTLTYATEIDNTKDESNLSSLYASVNFYGEKGGFNGRITGNQIKSNEKGMSIGTGEIPEGTIKIQAYKLRKMEKNENKKAAARKHKLQKGDYATYWTPNPSEIVTQDQYNKLVNAITSLGGSI